MSQTIDQRLNGFDDYVAEQMQAWSVPGVAVGIIHKGEVLHKSYGLRDVNTQDAVDSDTLFSIGSCTKAFTTMALALLIEQGKLSWDTPIRKYMPDFELADSVATAQLTLRDVASHRSGLPRHDLMWYGSDYSRAELIQRLRYLQPNQPFRYVFQYQNQMYMLAGYLIEQITGQTWEAFVQEHIFKPLNMDRSQTELDAVLSAANVASPHGETDGKAHVIPHYDVGALAPAGAVYSNLNDMTRWMQLHLNAGKHNGEAFIAANAIKEMHKPQIIMPPVPGMVWSDYPEIPLNTSGLGWAGLTYRGFTAVRHMGAIDGFVAQVMFIPSEDAAVIVLTNVSGNLLPVTLLFEAFDRVLGLDAVDWDKRLLTYRDQTREAMSTAREAQTRSRRENCPMSHPLADYAGQYENAAYGVMQIRCEGDETLSATRGRNQFSMTHHHYDTFLVEMKGAPLASPGTFYLNPAGNIEEFRILLEPAVDPIVFKRVVS